MNIIQVRLSVQECDDPEHAMLWKLAAERFSVEPYSNGRDARYEQVKAELRNLWGHDVIHSRNKARLKQLALNRGIEENEEENEEERREQEQKEEEATSSRTSRGSSAASVENTDEDDENGASSDHLMKNKLLLPRLTVSTLALRGSIVNQAYRKEKKKNMQGCPSSFMLQVTVVTKKDHEEDKGDIANANLVDGNERTLCGVWSKPSKKRPQVLVFAGQTSWALGGHFHDMSLRVDIVERKAKNLLMNAITGKRFFFSLSLFFFPKHHKAHIHTHTHEPDQETSESLHRHCFLWVCLWVRVTNGQVGFDSVKMQVCECEYVWTMRVSSTQSIKSWKQVHLRVHFWEISRDIVTS